MSKFKVGDIIVGRPNNDYTFTTSEATMRVVRLLEDNMRVEIINHSGHWSEVGNTYVVLNSTRKFALQGDQTRPYQRRTFRLLKETPHLKAGALVQEECDDGTQPYKVINLGSVAKYETPGDRFAKDRALVEDQPKWFVEVFKVTPEYMTREELDQWEAFKASRPAKSKKPAAVDAAVKKPATRASHWTPAKRRAMSRKMKARWAAKKAA